jgi:Porin PorA
MRRVAGFVCLFLGALVFTVGVLAKPVLYHNLAKVSLDQKTTLISIGKHMSALEVSSAGVRVLTDATLQNTRIVVGIPGKAKGNNAFWQYLVVNKQVDGKDLNYSQEGVSIDRFTAQATNCCGDYISTGTLQNPSAIQKDFTHKGLFFKLPFDTQKITYQWWDGDLGRTEPMKFVGTHTIQGVPTYVFQQKTGPVVYGAQTGVPGELFNSKKPVNADEVYQNTRTLYVEPNTGLIIDGVEQQNKLLRAPGFSPVPITVGTIGYTPATIKNNIADLGSKGTLLGFINGPLTWIGILVGLLLLAAGALLAFGGSQVKETTPEPKHAADRSLLDPR